LFLIVGVGLIQQNITNVLPAGKEEHRYRYLADLFLQQEDGKWLNINQDLVDHGLAVHKIY